MSAKNPFGLHTVTPYLVVSDVRKLFQFLKDLFDAEERGQMHLRENGSVQHAEIMIGDSTIMAGEAAEGIASPTSVGMYVYVDDVDASYKKALELGAVSEFEPRDYDHGDRLAGVRDEFGNGWWMATHKSELG